MSGGNLFTAVLVAPVVCVMSGLSLTVLQRSLEWIASIAKDPSPKGYFRTMKPYARQLNDVLDRVMGGSKITVNLNAILMMAVVVVLIWMLLNNNEQAQSTKKASSRSNSDKKNN